MKRLILFALFAYSILSAFPQKNRPDHLNPGPHGYFNDPVTGRQCEYVYCDKGWNWIFNHGHLDLYFYYPAIIHTDDGSINRLGSVHVKGCDVQDYELGDTIMLYSGKYGRYYPFIIGGAYENADESIKNITTIKRGFSPYSSWNCEGYTGLKTLYIGSEYDGSVLSCKNCYNLTSVNVAENVNITVVIDEAFYNCYKLKDISFLRNVTEIGEKGFYNCSDIKDINALKNLTTIGEYAFERSGIESLKLPDEMRSIPDGMCSDCVNLHEVRLPKQCAEIGTKAFYNCKKLDSIIWPDTALTIRNEAFRNTGFHSITLPDSIIRYEYSAFADCSNLTDIWIPKALPHNNNFSRDMFMNCHKLNNITFEPGTKKIGCGMFKNCSSLSYIEFPDSLSAVGHEAFMNCTGLTEINLPDFTSVINSCAFSGCRSLTSVSFKAKRIYGDAFTECPNLRHVFSRTEEYPILYYDYGSYIIAQNIFDLTTLNQGTLYLPSERAIANYSAPNDQYRLCQWYRFKNKKIFNQNTGVDEIQAEDDAKPKVEIGADGVVLTGADGMAVSAYTADGRMVYTSPRYDGASLPLAKGRIYIIKVNGKHMKVAL